MTSSTPWISELGLDAVLQRLPVAVVVVEAGSFRIVEFNDRAQDMAERQLGRSVPETLEDWWEIFHLDGRPYLLKERPVVRSITCGEEVDSEEYFSLLADGSRLIVRSRSAPIYGDDGEIVAGVLVMEDITEQKRVEDERAFHASLIDNVEDGVIATDAEDFRITAWNKGAERLYGFTAQEVLGRPARQVASFPGDQSLKLERDLLETGRTRIEFTAHRKEGPPVEVEVIAVAVKDDRGEVTGHLGIHRNITERKRAEEALRKANKRTETILDSITECFVGIDSAWRYTYVNQITLDALQVYTGRAFALGDLVGKVCWEVFPGFLGTTIEHELRRSVREQKTLVFESYASPFRIWMEMRTLPSKDGGLTVYWRDVTERRRAEADKESRVRQQALVADLGLRALSSNDLQALMDEAVRLVARTLDVELTGVAEMPAATEEVILRAGVGWREEAMGRQIERGERDSLAGYTLLHRAPVISEDHASDPRFKPSKVAQAHGVVSALSVMIESPEEPFGVLGAMSTHRRSFSPSDVSFVQAVANVLASAIERSRAEQRLVEARVLERGRIARALHDEALQGLMDALVLAMAVDEAPAGARRGGRLVSVLRRVGEQLRGAIYDLRSGADEQGLFVELLEGLVGEHRAVAGGCEIELELGDGVPSGSLGDRGLEVLRVVGEALTNARRHGDAGHVRVRVWGVGGRLWVEVSDDGRGFDSTRRLSALHHGITGMRERAQLLGGRLEIRGGPGTGTTMRLEAIPIDATSADR